MAGKAAASSVHTPAKPALSQSGSTGKQRSILGFFSKAGGATASGAGQSPSPAASSSGRKKKDTETQCLKESNKSNSVPTSKRPVNITPVPSSDALEPPSSQENIDSATVKVFNAGRFLLSPVTPAEIVPGQADRATPQLPSSPSRNVCLPP